METKWRIILMLLKFCSGVTAAPPVVKEVAEGQEVDIRCHISGVPSVVWFQILDGSGMDFVAAVTSVNPKVLKYSQRLNSSFTTKRLSSNSLTLKSFNARSDSGIYSCAAFGNNKDLKFGPVTRLQSEKKAEPLLPSVKDTPTKSPVTIPAPCLCPTPSAAVEPTQCSLRILAPLAGGCGLLLLILLCTILYCNSVRTRRCPHHYKRKPRAAPQGNQFKTNSHI